MTPCPAGMCLSPRSCRIPCGASDDWRRSMPPIVIRVEPHQLDTPDETDEPLWVSIPGALGALVILPTLFVLAMVALGVKP